MGLHSLVSSLLVRLSDRFGRVRSVAERVDRPLPEGLAPHDCPHAADFLPNLATHVIGFTGPTGDVAPFVVFDGIFCMHCRRELACAACGRTPRHGALHRSTPTLHRELLSCCEAPCSKFAVRLHGGAKMPVPPSEDPEDVNGELVDPRPLPN
jgi:hypothetical protein